MLRALFTIIILCCLSASAEEIDEEPTAEESFLEFHQQVSDRLTGFASTIDTFFGSVKDQKVYNKTKLRLYQTFSKTEGESFESKFNFRINLDLPQLKERFRFSIERNDKTTAGSTVDAEELTTERERTEDRRLRGSFSLLFNELANFNMRLSTGVRFDIPPTPFAEFKISRNFPMETWNIRYYSNTFWSHRSGFGQSVSLDWELEPAHDILFRFVNEATWRDENDKLITAHGPGLYHTLSSRRMMFYKARANYINRPHFMLESYDLTVSYRQVIKTGIFFYELIPSLNFPKEDNFKSVGKIALQLELVF